VAEQVDPSEEYESAATISAATGSHETVLSVRDPNASTLIDALQAAGATLRVVPDASFLNVKSVSCTAGRVSASCIMTGERSVISASTTKAKNIVSALKAAGVSGQAQGSNTVYKVKTLDCSLGTLTGRPIGYCSLTVVTP